MPCTTVLVLFLLPPICCSQIFRSTERKSYVVIRYDGSHMQPDPYIEGADASPSLSLSMSPDKRIKKISPSSPATCHHYMGWFHLNPTWKLHFSSTVAKMWRSTLLCNILARDMRQMHGSQTNSNSSQRLPRNPKSQPTLRILYSCRLGQRVSLFSQTKKQRSTLKFCPRVVLTLVDALYILRRNIIQTLVKMEWSIFHNYSWWGFATDTQLTKHLLDSV